MKKIFLLTVIIANVAIAFAQTDTGIHFEKEMGWGQILDKAKTEHKDIFVDCYATWCEPCKWMDANVYTQKAVGEMYNNKFISVKVQMDRTSQDDSLTKLYYAMVGYFARDLGVNAYPTFLFFSANLLDQNNIPLHKVAGSLDAKAFLQMADDAQNPDKQYFKIVKNFQPGKLDTGEEKSLARFFRNSDKGLAEKMALDYLTRIPQDQLSIPDNGILMLEFQNNPDVLNLAIDYIHRQGLKNNRSFIEQFSGQHAMKQLAIDSIRNFNDAELGKGINLRFMKGLGDDTIIRKIAVGYINRMPKDGIYTKDNIDFISAFTQKPSDRGFDLFYRHSEKVNRVMGRGDYSESKVIDVINKVEVNPVIKQAKASGIAPDFDSLNKILSKKYDAAIAKKATINCRFNWNNYLVRDQKKEQYWPDLISARIAQIDAFRQDTIKGKMQTMSVNNMAYDIFLRSDDRKQLETATRWMETVVRDNPDEAGCWDTYADLIYKIGNTDQAISWEQKALELAKNSNDKDNIQFFGNGIEKMKRGEKIWLQKEYLDN